MARNKKNNKKETFNVYPYLGQYQYLMRTGGQLPWYQDEGPVEKKKKYTITAGGRTYEFDTYEEYKAKWEELMPNMNVPPDPYAEDVDEGEPVNPDEVIGAETKCTCPEGYEKAGTEYYASGKDCRFDVMCGEKLDPNAPDTSEGSPEGSPEGEPVDDESTGKTTDDQELEGSPEGDGSPEGEEYNTDCEDSVYIECAKKGLKTDPNTCECIEEVEESSETEKQKAISDYQNGIISKKEMEDIVYSHNLGKGKTEGLPDYELSPTSKWGLLADALDSTGRAIKGFGRRSINPKTGKPYTKADFKQTTLDTSGISNESGAQLYWDDANLQKFIESGDKDMVLSDIIGTQGMHTSRRFNEFQDHRDALIKDYYDKGHLETTDIASRQTMDRVTGDITYDDIEYEEEVQTRNPEYIAAIQNIPFDEELEGHPSLEGIPEFITTTETKTRAFNPETDRTDFDIARDKTKDYSVTDILVNPDANVTSLVRTGPQADPNVIGKDGNITELEIEEYDPESDYSDITKKIVKTDEQRKREEREAKDNENNEDNEDNDDGLVEESRTDNGDGTVTIKYTNGSTKIIKKPVSSQQKKNEARKNQKEEASMGLEMFVYGGPKRLNKYQDGKNDWRDEKVHNFLEYHPNFPRTGDVRYTGDFTARELQDAITRDSTAIENSLDNSFWLRNFIGQDQTHQSNLGPAGKLQLNREWLHKLLMQDDQERASKLNFYRDGGALPFYEDGDENKSDGPDDPPTDENSKKKEVPVDNTNEEVNDDATDPNANATGSPAGSPEGDGSPEGEGEEEAVLSEEEMNELDETTVADSGVVDSSYGNIYNRGKAITKTGIVDRAINTYGDWSGAATKWADFGNALLEGWQNDVAEAKAISEGTTGEDQFMVQESSQGIHDPNSGDSFTNQKVDEIYSGNTMKAPLVVQAGGNPEQMAQPVVDNINYAALAEFTGTNPWGVEVSYSPEVIAYQKQIMAKMGYGGQLPTYQGDEQSETSSWDLSGWLSGEQGWIPDYKGKSTTESYQENKDAIQTGLDAASMTGIPVVSQVAGYGSAAIDLGDAYSAYKSGDTDTMKAELAKAGTTAALSTVPGGNIVKAGVKGVTKATGNQLVKNIGESAVTKGIVKSGVKKGTHKTIDAVADSSKTETTPVTPVTNKVTTSESKPKLFAKDDSSDKEEKKSFDFTGSKFNFGSKDKEVSTQDKPKFSFMKTDDKEDKAKYGKEVEVDYEILQELIKAGADIEII